MADAIASDPMRSMEYPTAEEIAKAFSQEGLVGNLYKNYEPRAEQRDMSTSVRDAFASGDNLVVEAGTGVGKSMAYLVPLRLPRRGTASPSAWQPKRMLCSISWYSKRFPRLGEGVTRIRFRCKAFDVCAVEGILPTILAFARFAAWLMMALR